MTIIERSDANRRLRFFALSICIALVTLGNPGGVHSQVNYGRTYTKADVERLVRNVESSAQEFRRDFDRWLDNSPIDATPREDEYNDRVGRLANSLSTLRSNFNRNNDWWQARGDMRRALVDARPVNTLMSSREVGGRLDRQWGRLRRDLDRLAEAFNLPPVGSSYYVDNYNPGNYPNQGGAVPNWSIGTFRGLTNNGESELTIDSNGTAAARSLNTNATFNGRFVNGVLYFDWGSFNVVRDGRGAIATVEIGNERNRTTYRRVSGDYVDNNPAPGSNVPNWAVGRFRGMTNNGETELTIASNGAATARQINSNALFNGQYSNGVLTFDWGSFNVVRDGRGISTAEVRNPRNRTTYTRVSGDYVDNYPGPGSNVPNWVVGRFRGMTNNGETELTIASNGAATARQLNSNAVYNGQYGNGVLTFDWGSFNVVRDGNGIATIQVGNEQNRTPYRRVN